MFDFMAGSGLEWNEMSGRRKAGTVAVERNGTGVVAPRVHGLLASTRHAPAGRAAGRGEIAKKLAKMCGAADAKRPAWTKGDMGKLQTPTSKLQRNSKNQASNLSENIGWDEGMASSQRSTPSPVSGLNRRS
jgi:hypothetical protein